MCTTTSIGGLHTGNADGQGHCGKLKEALHFVSHNTWPQLEHHLSSGFSMWVWLVGQTMLIIAVRRGHAARLVRMPLRWVGPCSPAALLPLSALPQSTGRGHSSGGKAAAAGAPAAIQHGTFAEGITVTVTEPSTLSKRQRFRNLPLSAPLLAHLDALDLGWVPKARRRRMGMAKARARDAEAASGVATAMTAEFHAKGSSAAAARVAPAVPEAETEAPVPFDQIGKR